MERMGTTMTLSAAPNGPNTLFLNGSNFRTGFTAGSVQIPGEVAPGVPVGLSIPYTINQPKPEKVVYTTESLSLSLDTPTFLPISSFDLTMGTIVPVDSTNTMYMLDYARFLEARITATSDPGTNIYICVSYISMYGQQGFKVIRLDNVTSTFNPLQSLFGICSIFLVADTPLTATLEFNINNCFELPITDYGLKSQLLMVTAYNYNDFNGLWISTDNDAAPYRYTWDGDYSVASDPMVPCTGTVANPRPTFKILNNGEPFGSDIDSYSFTFIQNVYGLGSGTQFINPTLPQIGSSTTLSQNVFGSLIFSEGFQPWRG
jgi:hypothetical protein